MPWFPDFVAAAELARREIAESTDNQSVTFRTYGSQARYYDDIEAPVGR